MGHGRGQPDRLPLARPLARSLAHARGTGHPPGGKGTRYESHARGPTPGPASTRLAPPPHPTPPPPAQAGGRRRGWEAEGNTDGRRHGEARAGGHGDGRAGRGAAGKGAQRRPGRETPPAGGNARAAARRTGAGGGGRQAREQREEKPGGRPPTARGPPCLPLSPSTQPHARVRPRRPTTDGWLEAGRPTPWSDTKTPRARGHEAPRGRSPGGSARRRKDTAASRGPPPGHASPGRGHARDTASGRAARPDRARRCLGGRGARKEPQAARRTAAGSRPDTAATAAAALGARGKREAAAARTRPPDRYRAGSQPRGAGTRPDAPTPPPAKHTMPKRPLAARGGSQRDGGGQGQRPRREPSGPSLPSHGRRAPPQGLAAAAARPQPTHPTVPHALRQASGRRGQGVGGWGAGQIRQEAEGARQCLHLGGRRAHGGPARTPQPRHPRRGKHPGGGD